MFGAVSRTEGALESGNEEVEGWYDLDTGLGGLWESFNGKPGFGSFFGERRAVSRDLIDFLFGELDASALGSSAAPASLRKSTIAASAACCPCAGARRLSPSVAVVLFKSERRDVASERGRARFFL
jgi:hypothetical protein